jgi:hypothetical protein
MHIGLIARTGDEMSRVIRKLNGGAVMGGNDVIHITVRKGTGIIRQYPSEILLFSLVERRDGD